MKLYFFYATDAAWNRNIHMLRIDFAGLYICWEHHSVSTPATKLSYSDIFFGMTIQSWNISMPKNPLLNLLANEPAVESTQVAITNRNEKCNKWSWRSLEKILLRAKLNDVHAGAEQQNKFRINRNVIMAGQRIFGHTFCGQAQRKLSIFLTSLYKQE